MIATAVEKDGYVNVYDDNGGFLFSRNGQLVGFTSNTVSIKQNGYTSVYDERGSFKFSR